MLSFWIQIFQLCLSKKKKPYSHHPFVFKCPILIHICYLFEFKYFKMFIKKKKITSSNKNPLPHIKTTHYYPKIFMFFLYIIIIIILILENIPKFWLSKFYTVIMNLHPSTLMYIIFLLFKSKIFLLITILIPINKFKCLIGFQLLTHCYINSL